jgi:hypothetical protein
MSLHALILSLWISLSPTHTLPIEAEPVAAAIVSTIEADAGNTPVLRSHVEDGLMMAVYAFAESGVQTHPVAVSWDARAHVSCGLWQQPCRFVERSSLRQQAGWELAAMRLGKRLCPAWPFAPLIGGCRVPAARRQAGNRMRILRRFLQATASSPVQDARLSILPSKTEAARAPSPSSELADRTYGMARESR